MLLLSSSVVLPATSGRRRTLLRLKISFPSTSRFKAAQLATRLHLKQRTITTTLSRKKDRKRRILSLSLFFPHESPTFSFPPAKGAVKLLRDTCIHANSLFPPVTFFLKKQERTADLGSTEFSQVTTHKQQRRPLLNRLSFQGPC
jgi:hypothetical protein